MQDKRLLLHGVVPKEPPDVALYDAARALLKDYTGTTEGAVRALAWVIGAILTRPGTRAAERARLVCLVSDDIVLTVGKLP